MALGTSLPTQVRDRSSAIAVPAATVLVSVLFALPPDASSPWAYTAAVVSLAASYLLVFFRNIRSSLRSGEYLLFAALVLGYIALSWLGFLRVDDRLFSHARVLPQAAGLLFMLITAPVLAHAARTIFIPRPRWASLVVILASAAGSGLLLQAETITVQGDGLYGVLSHGLMIQFIYFLFVLTVPSRLLRFCLVLAPFPLLLAASNIAIQLVLALCVLLPRARTIIPLLAAFLMASTLAIAFQPGPLAPLIAGDGNTMVRSHLWRQALDAIPDHPLGVGFGHSSVTFEGLKDPYVQHVFSHRDKRSLEVANHHTYLDTALRLGWAGLALFLLLLARAWRRTRGAGLDVQAAGTFAFMLIPCAFNPVLESVHSTMFFAFGLGYLWAIRLAADEAAPDADETAAPSWQDAAMPPAQRRRELAALAAQRA